MDERRISLSVITPVFNRADITDIFLRNHAKIYSSFDGLELVVVNNGSLDHTPGILSGWKSVLREKLNIVNLDSNRGFSGGNNAGAEVARNDNLLFLSNDVTPHGDYVSMVINTLFQNPGVLLGGELFTHDTGWNTFLLDGIQITIPYLGGWCVGCRRDVFKELGGWDERYYPCDYEDLDLSYTAARLRHRLLHIKLPLIHAFGETARGLPEERITITTRNRAKFIEKWSLSPV